MVRKYPVKNLAVALSILEALEEKKKEEGRLGSLTAFASEILNRYVSGALISEELLRAKIEGELREKMVRNGVVVDVKAHRSPKETHGRGQQQAS